MLKRILIASLLLTSHAYADFQKDPETCKISEKAIKVMIHKYIPKDKNSCATNDDCTFLQIHAWQEARGVNIKTGLAYERLYKSRVFKALQQIKDLHCDNVHPQVIFPRPEDGECVQNVCVAVFK